MEPSLPWPAMSRRNPASVRCLEQMQLIRKQMQIPRALLMWQPGWQREAFTGKPLTEKGDALTELVKDLLAEADASDEEKVSEEERSHSQDCGKASLHTPFPGRLGWKRHRCRNSILLYGRPYINRAWPAEPVRLYVPPASAMTSKIMIRDMA